MEDILKYFPNLSGYQQEQFTQLLPLYQDWNAKINVVSRKDIEQLYLHHVLHSLAIAKSITFKAGAEILDLGTGGGFPGIPLAIMFPEVKFTLVDGIGKKIKVVQEVATALGLKNVIALHKRAEEMPKHSYDFVVSRAVAALDKLTMWGKPLLKRKHQHALPNGLLLLKGGDLKEELAALHRKEYIEQQQISKYFADPYFVGKYVLYVQG